MLFSNLLFNKTEVFDIYICKFTVTTMLWNQLIGLMIEMTVVIGISYLCYVLVEFKKICWCILVHIIIIQLFLSKDFVINSYDKKKD